MIESKAVFAGDICLINATSHCDFTSDPCQVLVCHCGQPGCALGGYVSFRRIDGFVVWLPAFAAMESDNKFDRTQYGPPDYLLSDHCTGAVFTDIVYAELASKIPEFPQQNDLPQLNAKEVLSSVQMHATLQVLGRFPELPKLNPKTILAVTDGDTEAEIRAVDSFIESTTNSSTPLTPLSLSVHISPIEFHLDGPGFPAWYKFARVNNQIGIVVHPFGVLVPNLDA